MSEELVSAAAHLHTVRSGYPVHRYLSTLKAGSHLKGLSQVSVFYNEARQPTEAHTLQSVARKAKARTKVHSTSDIYSLRLLALCSHRC